MAGFDRAVPKHGKFTNICDYIYVLIDIYHGNQWINDGFLQWNTVC